MKISVDERLVVDRENAGRNELPSAEKDPADAENCHPRRDRARPSAGAPNVTVFNRLVLYCRDKARLKRDRRAVKASGLFDPEYYLSNSPALARQRVNLLQHYFEIGSRSGLNPNPLFSNAYYLSRNPDIALAEVDPLAHYVVRGAQEGRRPHPLFDTEYYVSQKPGLNPKHANPLKHYVTQGWIEGCNPHPLFNVRYYLSEHPDVATSGAEPLTHFVTAGWKTHYNPHPVFDVKYYLTQRPNIGDSGMDPLSEYVSRRGRNYCAPHPLFDVEFYLAQNPEVRRSPLDPLVHYLTTGWISGCNPHPLFDGAFYLEANPDVARAGINPLVHYLVSGWRESRQPHPLFDIAYYLSQKGGRQSLRDPLTSYVMHGHSDLTDPHPLFDSRFYLSVNPDVADKGVNPLIHFVLHGWKEGRDPHPHFDTAYYVSQNPDLGDSDALTHYVSIGFAEGRDPNPVFGTSDHLKKNHRILEEGMNPLVHFLNSRAPFDLGLALRHEVALSGRVDLDHEYHSCPLVTTIVACHGAERFIEQAILSSLLACSYPQEIIVCVPDDEVTESLVQLAEKYSAHLLRSGSRNHLSLVGIEHARGQFIQILDAHCLLLPDKVDLQLEHFHVDSDIDVCLANYELSDERGLNRRSHNFSLCSASESGHVNDIVRLTDSMPVHCALFRTGLLRQIRNKLPAAGGADLTFWQLVACESPRIKYDSTILAIVRHSEGSEKLLLDVSDSVEAAS
jgi:hypothetical protein